MTDMSQRATVRLSDYRPTDFHTETVDMCFLLDPARTVVRTRTEVVHADSSPPDAPLVLLGDGPELISVSVDGETWDGDRLRRVGDDLEIHGLPERASVEVVTAISPEANSALMGLYVSNGIFCTQCEAEGFRRITFFQDRPDVLARYRVRIEADKERCPVLLSNGNLLDSGDLADGRHFVQWEDPFPKPSYLFALVAGDLALLEDWFVTMSGREVVLRIYSEHACIDQCGHAMESLKKSMRWDEERYGLEYDLDLFQIVAVSDFNMGAMENKGLNIFNTSATLAERETATDRDFVSVERIIAHEYFHNWTGNRVTCRDWFQLTLKEGLTVFRDQQFTSDMHSAPVKRISDVMQLRDGQFLEDAGPLAHPIRPDSYIEINNFYTRTVYDKGAEVIRMIHTLIGEEAFRRGMDLYFERHDGQAVTCEDFVAAMADASGRDLGRFGRWYAQAGTPVLEVQRHWSPESGRYTLELSQSTPATPGQESKEPFHIPVRMGLTGATTGRALPLRLEGENTEVGSERILELTEASQTFTFVGLDEEPIPSLLRGFSAPVRLDLTYGRDELAFLLAHDADPFCRWEAGQTLALQVMAEMLAQHTSGKPLSVDQRLIEAMGAVLDDGSLDPAFMARAVSLPSRSYFAQSLAVIDVDGVSDVRDHLCETLGSELEERWRAAYERNRDDGPFSISSEAMARRSLRNCALGYLVDGGKAGKVEAVLDLARAQLEAADNMTDRLAALRALCDARSADHEERLEAFYEAWRHQPLVIDKWFALQAMMEDGDSVERIRRLMRHPAFSFANPNRLRSLVGVFCGANLRGFHRADGAGYALLGEVVRELDRKNPQIASRLITPLGRWRRYDTTRRDLMRGELERILALESLSSDSFEIASKSLGK